MVSQTDIHRLKCITNGVNTYSKLPKPSPRDNIKGYLKNLGQNTSHNTGRVQSDESLRSVYVNDEKKIDTIRCITNTDGFDLAAIAGDTIMGTNMMHVPNVFGLFITFMKKDTIEAGGFREISDVLPDDLIGMDGNPITLTSMGLDGDNDNPKLVLLPMAFPVPNGYPIPIGHKVSEALPPATDDGWNPLMTAWLEGIKNLEDLNGGVPVTSATTAGGNLFNPAQFRPSNEDDDDNNYDKICNEGGELLSKDSYHINPNPILPGSDIHNRFFDETERTTLRTLFDYVQGLPSVDMQVKPPQGMTTDFANSIADGIVKGMKSSAEEAKSGFSNKVKGKMRLLGSFTGVNDNGEPILIPGALSDNCKAFFMEKNKIQATRIFQDGLRAEAQAMQNEGGNIAASDLIFETEQFNTVFTTMLKSFSFLPKHLNSARLQYDSQISLLNFLPADERNPAYRKMIESDRTAQEEDAMESDLAKHTKKTTKLFVDGNQETMHHLCTCLATLCCFIRSQFTNGKQSIVYKGFMSLIQYLKSAEGVNWLSTEGRTHKHVVHHLLCESQSLLLAALTCLSFNDVLVQKVESDQDIEAACGDRVKTTFDNILRLWQQRSLDPVSSFTIAPTTYSWFPIGTGQLVAAYQLQQLQKHQQQLPPAQQAKAQGDQAKSSNKKAKGQQARDNNTGNGGGKRQKTEAELNLEKQGWLVLRTPAKKLPRFDKIIPGLKKRLCGGNAYKGRACGALPGKCNCAHIPSADDLPPGEYKRELIAWVEDEANNTQFAPGKAPKNRE